MFAIGIGDQATRQEVHAAMSRGSMAILIRGVGKILPKLLRVLRVSIVSVILAIRVIQIRPPRIIPTHIITGNFDDFPKELKQYEYLRDRAMIVKKAKRLDVECIVRGYLAGSGWKEYQKSQTVCGVKLPQGLKQSQQLPEPIFTPSTKAADGEHDENISFERTAEIVGEGLAAQISEISIKLYKKVSQYCKTKGIIWADTKLEFGIYNGKLILIDEIFTPDSSRFWEKDKYEVGKSQDSLDKQFVRDYLEQIKWNKQPPVPVLPEDIIEKTKAKYIEAYEKITGKKF